MQSERCRRRAREMSEWKGRIGTCYVYICGGELTEFSLVIYMDLFCCLICLQTDLEKETAAGCYYRWKVCR